MLGGDLYLKLANRNADVKPAVQQRRQTPKNNRSPGILERGSCLSGVKTDEPLSEL